MGSGQKKHRWIPNIFYVGPNERNQNMSSFEGYGPQLGGTDMLIAEFFIGFGPPRSTTQAEAPQARFQRDCSGGYQRGRPTTGNARTHAHTPFLFKKNANMEDL